MTLSLTIAVMFGSFLTMVVLIHGLNVFRDVRVARWTATDPRRDENAVAEAAAKVAGRKRHPSAGGDGNPKEGA